MRTSDIKKDDELAPEIYIPLVDSLFKGPLILIIGSVFVVGGIVASYLKSGATPLLLCAVAFAVVAVIRLWFLKAYDKVQGTIDVEEARRWEHGYVLGASSSVGLLGLWCYLAFAVTDDAFARLISFSLTIGYIIGIFGRNFGSPKFVVVQILCAWVPMTAALLLHGSGYYWFLAALLMPLFLAVKLIAERLRRTLLDAIVATHDMSTLARRFDTAITNMPHGMLMFDQKGFILVANQRVAPILKLRSDVDLKGWSTKRLIRHCVKAGIVSIEDAKSITEHLESGKLDAADEFIVESGGDLTLAITLQPMREGGGVAVIQDISERRLAEQTINRMAHYDTLTGLPNRHSFNNRLRQAFLRDDVSERCALLFVDLDNFKQVNDTLGHSCGDMLLQRVSERLQDLLRESDMPARFGGDEFVILQSHMNAPTDASALANRVINELSRPYRIGSNEVVLGASVGIAKLGIDGDNPEKVLKNADVALYAAKAAGKKTYRFFEPEMDARAQARRSLELDLREAIEQDQFEMFYQPIIDLKTGDINTCEALVRWHHPKRGLVSPAEFIPVAEETGAILDIGRMALEKACVDCLEWPEDITVAVNISPVQFGREDVTDVIVRALKKTGLSASRLGIEITETALVEDTSAVRGVLQRLQAAGVAVALDDFGTGYSSLSYLHSLPLNKVKIDRAFLEGVTSHRRSRILLSGITRLSADLGLKVTVEGIETEDQLALVKQEDFIHDAQGYLFSRPVPPKEIKAVIAKFRERSQVGSVFETLVA
ncbi:MAG: putative bifunctional diguanylate cyclase/phosphodiesterase [Hyphomicrobiaceae bacterium]